MLAISKILFYFFLIPFVNKDDWRFFGVGSVDKGEEEEKRKKET
jgi:hypothetical protein